MAIPSSNVSAGFIDLATYDELERYLYGGPDSTAYFVRLTRKSTWFTQIPMLLSKTNGSANFGQEWSVQISRAGDYLLNNWLRVTFPAVTLNANNQFGVNGSIRWCQNLMHNIIREANISFNDLVAARFDNFFLDFMSEFSIPAGKRNGYNNMIGNINDLTAPHSVNLAIGATLPQVTLNLPLPFFYSRDSGIALPTAALPYNEIRIGFSFRDWTELLILDNAGAAGAGTVARATPIPGNQTTGDLATGTPTLVRADVWATYAIVSNDERKLMGAAPRDILIEQCQTTPRYSFSPVTNAKPIFDLRFSHAIKCIFFAVHNITFTAEQSNYTTSLPYNNGGNAVNFTPSGAYDPILQTSLNYEGTTRFSQMGSDYYSLIVPFFNAPAIPTKIGYHLLSYSLDINNLDPMGSTNYGKLSGVQINPECSQQAVDAANGIGAAGSGYDYPQKFEFVACAVDNTVIRISAGALGFPVL